MYMYHLICSVSAEARKGIGPSGTEVETVVSCSVGDENKCSSVSSSVGMVSDLT